MDLPEIDVHELERHLAGGAPVYDVREHDEYVSVHVPGAILVPLATVPDELHRFEGDEPVFLICARGGRSAKAVEFMRARGIDAVNVAGGTGSWVEAGKPTVAGSEPG